jgi:hypothetical protein
MPKSDKGFLVTIFVLLTVICLRFLFVYLPTVASPAPRMGDDTIAYLWKAKLNFIQMNEKSPAVEIAKDVTSKIKGYKSDRVAMRAYGIGNPFYDLFTSFMLRAGLSYQTIFLIFESFILVLYTIGAFFLLSNFLSYPFAALGILLTVFQPDKYVATNLSAAFAFFLWHSGIKPKLREKKHSLYLVPLTLFSHSVGLIYVTIYIGMDFFFRKSFKRSFILVGYLVFLILVQKYAFFWMDALTSSGTGGLSFRWDDILANLSEAQYYLITNKSFVFIAACAFVYLLTSIRKSDSFKLRYEFLVLAFFNFSVVLVSFFFMVPGHPNELGYRLMINLFIILSVPAIASVMSLKGNILKSLVRNGLCVLAFAALYKDLKSYNEKALRNVNERRFLIDESKFSLAINELDKVKPVLVTETDHLYMYSLLSASHLNIYPFPLIKDDQRFLKSNIESFNLIHPLPEKLNALSFLEDKTFNKRYYGFPLRNARSLTIDKISSPFIYLKFKEFSPSVEIKTLGDESLIPLKSEQVLNGWYKLSCESCRALGSILISGPGTDSWIVGIKLDLSQDEISWPWGNNDLSVTFQPLKNKSFSMTFDNSTVLSSEVLSSPLIKNSKIVYKSDVYGALFISLLLKQ